MRSRILIQILKPEGGIMLSSLARVSLWLVAVLVVSVFPISLRAQESSAQEKSEEKMEHKSTRHTESVTGCLQKGDEAGGFSLTGDDGKMWELSSRKVKLADHVGHKVTVTGVPAHHSKTHEEKMETTEKKEAAGKEYGDLRVSSLKMVSESCQ
jgi:uncharacterized protein DUF5818